MNILSCDILWRTSSYVPYYHTFIVSAGHKHVGMWTEVNAENDIGMAAQGVDGFSLDINPSAKM